MNPPHSTALVDYKLDLSSSRSDDKLRRDICHACHCTPPPPLRANFSPENSTSEKMNIFKRFHAKQMLHFCFRTLILLLPIALIRLQRGAASGRSKGDVVPTRSSSHLLLATTPGSDSLPRHSETIITDHISSPLPFIRPLSPLAQVQAAHYRNHTGLMLNLHITHHGGTTFCNKVGHSPSAQGNAPGFACWKVRGEDHVGPNYPHYNPWKADETAINIATARRFFHMISWEYAAPPVTPLAETMWEDPHLFSVLVVRDPIHRLMAGDMEVARDFPGVLKGKAEPSVVKAYAESSRTDNYALRILSGIECCQDLQREDLERAKELIRRFSVVIDIECLDESLQSLAENEWNLKKLGRTHKHIPKRPPKERIKNDEIYDSLRKKNELDSELYEWAKTISFLDCSQNEKKL